MAGRVVEINLGVKFSAAYLYGFGIALDKVRDEHKKWLSAALIFPARTIAQGNSATTFTDPRGEWQIWLCGTTSRTGSATSNLALSKRRADAIAEYLNAELRTVVYRINRSWVGESLAVLKGRKDHIENPLDRAVIIAFRRFEPPETIAPPPPVQDRPTRISIPCCYWKQEFDYLNAVKNAWLYSMRTGFRDTGDYRTTKPDRAWLKAWLTQWGWSHERAEELYETGPYTNVNLEHAMGVTTEINRELEQWKKLKANCSSDDPDNICRTGYLRYR